MRRSAACSLHPLLVWNRIHVPQGGQAGLSPAVLLVVHAMSQHAVLRCVQACHAHPLFFPHPPSTIARPEFLPHMPRTCVAVEGGQGTTIT